ncbi:hypothetical protein QVD17_29978 [Tagetes erecta]|uniref:LOB domain-containing protein n=1 Tax=Tagetes erecta TaxID=13708 RepID=A0AAD8K4K4_TARER|nr:hypothetical protein QVD17_29978 [Tagetes erecta]
MTNNHHHHHNKIIHHNHHNNHLLPPPPPRSTSTIQACAACRYQRRKCAPDCILAPYFPHDRQRQFQNAHKLFGVSNITKIIRNLDRVQKDEAMRTIIYQSDVRSIDPVGGCYRIVRELQRQIEISCAELEFVMQQLALCRTVGVQNNNHHHHHQQFNHDLIEIDEIDYDIQIVNNQDESNLFDESCDNHHPHHHHQSHDLDNLTLGEHKNADHASVCDDFKSLLINEIQVPEERNESSEEQEKELIKVENVCYNEAIHVEGEYGC